MNLWITLLLVSITSCSTFSFNKPESLVDFEINEVRSSYKEYTLKYFWVFKSFKECQISDTVKQSCNKITETEFIQSYLSLGLEVGLHKIQNDLYTNNRIFTLYRFIKKE